ncbi:MAG: leucyl/phenylalanyl-tRNA--protein transferase [Spirochaetaceae bacterium]|jgi:leucyl/phenylalanyl-tRNA--protein transferase|nr:leucyl/phenylalanyl-tRNA--protein transferase [Spirochaetaceae bacterium]
MRLGFSGQDPNFPYIAEHQRFQFPNPEKSKDGVVAIGGNLSPGMLLSAYEQGVFPWYNPDEPVVWQSPDPRFVIFPEKLHVSTSMKKILNQRRFDVRFDSDFPAVIRECAAISRTGQNGTWITEDMINAYNELHRLGYAHCAESYAEGSLAGGCYGILLGSVFFGESMFSKQSNASKAAFVSFAKKLFAQNVAFIDCQVWTAHLESLGGERVSRCEFLKLLKENIR